MLVFCFLIPGFFVQGESKEKVHSADGFLSKYENFPEEIETANLRLKTGFSYFLNHKTKSPMSIPLFLELKGPIGIDKINTKWLISSGVEWFIGLNKFCDSSDVPDVPEKPEPPFDDSFFQEIYQKRLQNYQKRLQRANDPMTCDLRNSYSSYFLIQSGLTHDFGSFTLVFRGGGVIPFDNLREIEKMGVVVDLAVTFHDFWDVGIKTLYHDDDFYIGINASAGISLKKWSVTNPHKD